MDQSRTRRCPNSFLFADGVYDGIDDEEQQRLEILEIAPALAPQLCKARLFRVHRR
jgi:hypothetical protein